ncbi:DUF4169 family protein [Flexibacterium corallicola]|uniref:DUF4169 family protein n=1 Tax=Flexibacterium corallicola TaxID=3037259 RepID=UPI00286EBD94|nr:DUF4169 family protein [Pseudovibrio sp. M1P-2-3]
MTAQVLNLRKFRKERKRANKEQQAQENRIRFGRSKIQENVTSKANEKAFQALNGHRLEKAVPTKTSEQHLKKNDPD